MQALEAENIKIRAQLNEIQYTMMKGSENRKTNQKVLHDHDNTKRKLYMNFLRTPGQMEMITSYMIVVHDPSSSLTSNVRSHRVDVTQSIGTTRKCDQVYTYCS